MFAYKLPLHVESTLTSCPRVSGRTRRDHDKGAGPHPICHPKMRREGIALPNFHHPHLERIQTVNKCAMIAWRGCQFQYCHGGISQMRGDLAIIEIHHWAAGSGKHSTGKSASPALRENSQLLFSRGPGMLILTHKFKKRGKKKIWMAACSTYSKKDKLCSRPSTKRAAEQGDLSAGEIPGGRDSH